MQEHGYSVLNGWAQGWPSIMICKWHAIAVKMGGGKIKDIVIRTGSLALAMVIHVLELCNLVCVSIWERLHMWGSAIGSCKGVKEKHEERIYCAQVSGFSPQIKESLTNNIIILEKENAFTHSGECIKIGHLGCELLEMIVRNSVLSQYQIVCTQASCQWCLDDWRFWVLKWPSLYSDL
jgi:hypothetical protein